MPIVHNEPPTPNLKVGDLAITHSGNLVVIADVGYGKKGRVDWYDIIFSTTGLYRGGFPALWVRRLDK